MVEINLGYACINTELSKEGISFKTLRLPNLRNIKLIESVIENNINVIYHIIKYNISNNIKLYRMTSEIFPFMSYIDVNNKPLYMMENLDNYEIITLKLKEIGKLAKSNNIRLTFHPSHFNCIASLNKSVVKTSILDLTRHAKIMDLMELENSRYNKINIHIGGFYDGKEKTLKRFEKIYNDYLPDSVKNRLTLENDDRPNLYAMEDLIDISVKNKIPIVFDTLHYHCNPGKLSYDESYNMAYDTWPKEIIPIFHHSSSKKIEKPSSLQRTHADYIYDKFVNSNDKDIYVILEAKAKEKALQKYLNEFTTN